MEPLFNPDDFDPDVQLMNPTPERLFEALGGDIAISGYRMGLAYQRALRLWGANDPRTLQIGLLYNAANELIAVAGALVASD